MRFGFASNKWNAVRWWAGIKPKEQKPDIGAQIEKGAFLSNKRISQIKEIGFELFLDKNIPWFRIS